MLRKIDPASKVINSLNKHYSSIRYRLSILTKKGQAVTFGMNKIEDGTLGGQGEMGLGTQNFTASPEGDFVHQEPTEVKPQGRERML
ncbi:MAG TPA: hypothetical protein VKC53_00455 [Patescibacteria group bacterium]|nr:hypothetical protein [Patescibacteria group bacterium]